MLNTDDFETDPAVELQLLRLEEITEDIVDTKRSKGGRRRRSPRNDSMEDLGAWDDPSIGEGWCVSRNSIEDPGPWSFTFRED
ncbi:hypothetical protein ACEPPN_004286 [Leptodophora sp. 'Broadleaf-Isolate-01']